MKSFMKSGIVVETVWVSGSAIIGERRIHSYLCEFDFSHFGNNVLR